MDGISAATESVQASRNAIRPGSLLILLIEFHSKAIVNNALFSIRPVVQQELSLLVELTGGASNEKAKRELGWQTPWASWRDGFRDGL
jgi:hypothetical protein